jgi:hypothetical protein
MPSPFRMAAGESAFVAGQCPRRPSIPGPPSDGQVEARHPSGRRATGDARRQHGGRVRPASEHHRRNPTTQQGRRGRGPARSLLECGLNADAGRGGGGRRASSRVALVLAATVRKARAVRLESPGRGEDGPPHSGAG